MILLEFSYSQDVLNKIKDKPNTRNIFRIQSDDSIMCGLYCIVFIEYMIAGRKFRLTNLFLLTNSLSKERQDNSKYFKGIYGNRKRKPLH